MEFLAWFFNFLFAARGGRILHGFMDFAGVLLKLAQQFPGLAGDEFQFVVCEIGALLLFQLALDDVKVAFDFEFCHKNFDGGVECSAA
jgi:hypothetical protein